eukprot:gene3872-7730_t
MKLIAKLRVMFSFAHFFLQIASESLEVLKQTNLLFIMFDDLRPELSIYGKYYMITPSFERLASKSVVFDQAYCQVSVCNPSRTSILTGLRPDTTGSYAFDTDYRSYMTFPKQLGRSGYKTYGIGKIAHWEEDDTTLWDSQFHADWYPYQEIESSFMNSTTMPDKVTPEESFRDHMFTTVAIDKLRNISGSNEYFCLGVGLKLPHLALHVPYKYFNMYNNISNVAWRLSERERSFPRDKDSPSYRCCAEPDFAYMNEEGALPAHWFHTLGARVSDTIPDDMRHELMLGYASAITFVDAQLGRILDVLDELSLWSNLTVVVTSDHGMHHGEKGLWEKWSLFDESTRVPLLIHHPASPFLGKRFTEPVELLDIYPTLNDILGAPYDHAQVCPSPSTGHRCLALQGKSLAPVILGDVWTQMQGEGRQDQNGAGSVTVKVGKRRSSKRGQKRRRERRKRERDDDIDRGGATSQSRRSLTEDLSKDIVSLLEASRSHSHGHSHSRSVPMDSYFALSQSWRCANRTLLHAPDRDWKESLWKSCTIQDNYNEKGANELSLMGYSLRTTEFRYTAWLHFNRTIMQTLFDMPPYDEELYDHRGELLSDFTHLEVVDLARSRRYRKVVRNHRKVLLYYLSKNIVFHGPIQSN